MANLKEIRTRIASVSSTRQITSAMKMVSAAKLRKAQDAILQLRPYSEKFSEILSAMSDALREDKENPYINGREVEKVLLVVISSNRGLCGAFNSSVIKRTTYLANKVYEKQKANDSLDLLIIGKKAEDYFKKRNYNILESHNDIFDELSYENVTRLAEDIMKRYVDGQYDFIELVYNQFKNAAVQILSEEQYLPIKLEKEEKEEKKFQTFDDYIFEPSKEYIVRNLIPHSLKLQLFKAILDSHASEHGARMTAMHKATDNATELIKDLKLDYNKARQASITNEILEIVSGANALEG
ncbi:MAG: ATP synthase F1 subunit gamma [Bacteroidales bacterium]